MHPNCANTSRSHTSVSQNSASRRNPPAAAPHSRRASRPCPSSRRRPPAELVSHPVCWEGLARLYGRRLRALARRTYCYAGLSSHAHEAEDVVQETWVRLYQRWGDHIDLVTGDRSLFPYLARTTRNLALDRARAHNAVKRGGRVCRRSLDEGWGADGGVSSRARALPRLEPASDLPSPEEAAMRRQGLRQFRRRCRPYLSGTTPHRDLAVVELAFRAGWSSREIADEVGSTPTAVDTLLHRVRHGLAGEGLDLPPRRG